MPRIRRGPMVAFTASALMITMGGVPASGATPEAGATAPRATFIRLVNRTFDPLGAGVTATTRVAGSRLYLVQFTAGLSDDLRLQLRRLGARLGAYVPDFAYVVRMSDATRAAVVGLAGVRWIGAYLPSDKLDAAVGAAALSSTGPRRYLITLVEPDGADQRGVAERVARLGGTVHVVSESRQHLEATLDAEQLRSVVRLDQRDQVPPRTGRR